MKERLAKLGGGVAVIKAEIRSCDVEMSNISVYGGWRLERGGGERNQGHLALIVIVSEGHRFKLPITGPPE